MNFYGATELAAGFRTVRKNTIIIAEEIDEPHYNFRATPDTRTIAETLSHVAVATGFPQYLHGVQRLSSFEGLDFPALFGRFMGEEKALQNKQQILTALQEKGEEFARWLESLSDEFLGERVTMLAGLTPPDKSRFEMLLGVKEHEMHHRGQLMLMERMIGVVPHLTRERTARMASMMAGKASA